MLLLDLILILGVVKRVGVLFVVGLLVAVLVGVGESMFVVERGVALFEWWYCLSFLLLSWRLLGSRVVAAV